VQELSAAYAPARDAYRAAGAVKGFTGSAQPARATNAARWLLTQLKRK
jgi:hypothetical protein